MKSWLIVGVILLLLPFVVADSCGDTCFSLGFDYGLCEAVSDEEFCTEGEEDIGILSCEALERCCCGFDEAEVEVVDEEVEEEEPVEEEEEEPIVLEPIIINSAPIVEGSSTEVEVGNTAVLTIEVKNNYLSYWFATVFGAKENVYIYDADGDDLSFSIEGDSGFATDIVYEYQGVYAFGWIVDEYDIGVYTDTVYVWDEEHADDMSAATFIVYVNNIEEEEEFVLDLSEEEEAEEEVDDETEEEEELESSFWDSLFDPVDDEEDVESTDEEVADEEEEEPVINVTIVDSTDDTEEEEVYVNKAPKVNTKDVGGIVNESVVLSVEVKESWFTYFWANLFRTDHNIHVYDKEGDGVYFSFEGKSGFAGDGVYTIYSGTHSLEWTPDKSGIYTDSVYVWDDANVNSTIVSTYTLTIDSFEEPVEEEVVDEEPVNETVEEEVVSEAEPCFLPDDWCEYPKFLATVLLILIVVLLLIYVLIPKKKESLFE